MSNLSDAKLALAGTLANDKGGEATVNQLTDFQISYAKAAADSMAADATAATRFWTNPFDFDVEVVSGYAVGGALTAHDTNFATITVATDDGANSTPAAALTWTTTLTGGTGTWSADIAKANTARTAANCTVAPGASVHFQIAKGGSGVVVPVSSYHVRLRRKA